jgi:hypothetical protein
MMKLVPRHWWLLLLAVPVVYLAKLLVVAIAVGPAHGGIFPAFMMGIRASVGLGNEDRPIHAGLVVRNRDFQNLYVDKGPHFNDGNTAVGEDVMRYVHKSAGRDSQYNTGIGAHALRGLTKGSDNTAVGAQALRNLTIGYHNTAVGHYALGRTTTGERNSALGVFALNENRHGRENTALGFQAMHENRDGHFNTAVGRQALYSSRSGQYNVSLGWQTLLMNAEGSHNTAVGALALCTLATGEDNVGIGHDTGNGIVTGSGNTIVGARVSGLPAELTNNIILASGGGMIRARHDGIGWALTGPVHASGGLRTDAEGEALVATGEGQRERAIHLGNAGGDFYVGIEGVTAGSYFTDASAYANVLYSTGTTPIEFIVAGAKRAAVTADGLAVSGGQTIAVARPGGTLFQVSNAMYFITVAETLPVTLRLPAGTLGRVFLIKNEGTGAAAIAAAEGEALFTNQRMDTLILAQGEAVELIWSGPHWSVLRFR